MADKFDSSISAEVESRLEELFMEDEAVFQDSGEPYSSGKNELRDLKAIVLSIDWEINDEIMTNLMEQIKKLAVFYKNDRILTLFLQLLGAIGKYIKIKKSASHPNSIKLLSSIYHSFEKAVHSNLTETDRKKLLQDEVDRFNELKSQISIRKESVSTTKPQETAGKVPAPKPAPVSEPPDRTEMPPELRAVLEEIKETIKQEFQSLKEELRLWRDRR